MRDTLDSTMAKNHYHHGNLREALIEAAAEEVAAHGANNLSLRAVARRAGVSQAAPYHHFKDKEALIAEICQIGFAELQARSTKSVEGIADAPSRLHALAFAYVKFARDRTAVFRVMFGGHITDKACYPELEEAAQCSMQLLTSVLAQGKEDGTLDVGVPEQEALVCWAGVHGTACLIVDKALPEHKLEEAGIDHDMVVSAVIARMQRGLAPVRS